MRSVMTGDGYDVARLGLSFAHRRVWSALPTPFRDRLVRRWCVIGYGVGCGQSSWRSKGRLPACRPGIIWFGFDRRPQVRPTTNCGGV